MSARRIAAVVAIGALLAALVAVVTDTAMASTSGDPAALYLVFVLSVAGAGVVGWWLTRAHRRLPSLRWTILVVASAAVVVATVVVAASTSAMFLSAAELRLVLAALLLGAGLGVIVAVSVTGPLTDDLRALAAAARRVADGDLTVRSGVQRGDEVGELATSLDRMVEQLAALEAQRARGEAARRRLLTSIGHDLRTPLASMQAAVEALEDGVAPDPDRYLRSLGNDITLLHSMVGDVFVLAQLEAGELHLDRLPIDLAEVVDGSVEAVRPLAVRQDVEVVAEPLTSAVADADPRAVDRVLRNLLDNAIRHAPASSCVSVTLTADVQGDGIYWAYLGWGPNKQTWHLARGFCAGATDVAFDGAWPKLDAIADRGVAFGPVRIAADLIGVDSGFNTEPAYAWVRRRHNALALKGDDGWTKLPIYRASSGEIRKTGLSAGKAKKFGIKVWHVGTWGIKGALMHYLARTPKEGDTGLPVGYQHYPADTEEEYFRQLVSEYVLTETVNGEKRRRW
jgi:two-component system, OmpR family, sensor histidine kinase BaeS